MCCFNFGRKVFSFALAFAVGLSIASVLQNESVINESRKEINSVKEVVRPEEENGIGSGRTEASLELPEFPRPATAGLKILSKPRANYTNSARQNNTQGTVSLRVIFLENGEIGNVSVVNGLPDGLTEQAIAAAHSITFQPAQVNGMPKTVAKVVQYSFTIY